VAKEEKQAETRQTAVFGKERILTGKRYQNRRDLLSVLLEDGESYTFAQVDDLIKKFMKGEVK
jgi:hypothetical protein